MYRMATAVYTAEQLFLIVSAVLILSNWQQAQANQIQQVVYVNSTEQCQEDYQCNNFTYLLNANDTLFSSNTIIHFLKGNHLVNLTTSLTVSNITNLVLRGPEVSPDKPPVAHIVISGEAFHIQNVANLTLAYMYINITSKYCDVLQFHNIYSMVMDNVYIEGSQNYGLYAHNVHGNFSITNCKFLSNGRNLLNWDCYSVDGGNAKITYDGFDGTKHNTLRVLHSEFGYGRSKSRSSGGLYIAVISSTATSEKCPIQISVSNCFFHDNEAVDGANMRISYSSEGTSNIVSTVSIVNSTFVSGKALMDGGGLYLHMDCNDNSNVTASIHIDNSTFLENQAQVSGGGLIMEVSSNFIGAHIFISSSKFIRNEAEEYGGGAYLLVSDDVLSSSTLNAIQTVVIMNSTFEANRVGYVYFGSQGGGLFLESITGIIEINSCKFMDSIASSGSGIVFLSPPSTLVIQDCSFTNGIAEMGGAIGVYPDCDCQILLNVSNSVFHNNTAEFGGAFHIENYESLELFLILRSTFLHGNIAEYGGVVYFDGRARRAITDLNVLVDRCNISNNYAKSGAGLNIALNNVIALNVVITECQMLSNRAEEASVIDITIKNAYMYNSTQINITNSQFFNNTVSQLQHKTSTVYLQCVEECLISRTVFSNNSGSCLLAEHTNILLQESVVFRDNTAFAGAAVLLDCPQDSLQPSFLNLLPNSTVIITNNTALHSGGGIAVNPDCKYDNQCFFQRVSPTLNRNGPLVHMRSNSAIVAGNSIYGPPIDHCSVAYHSSGYAAFSGLFEVVHSMPGDIVFAGNYELCFCSASYNKCNTNIQVEVHSGQEFNISIVVSRSFQDLSDVSFIRSNILTSKPALLGPLQDIQELRRICGNLTFSVMASASTIAQIELSIEFAPTAHNSYVNITVLDCPIGFKLDDEFVCDCDPYLTSTIQDITCDINTNTLRVPGKVWIGNYTNGKLLAHPYCPLGYCNPQTHSLDLQNQDEQCTSNRSDILCGACRNRFSLTLGTVNCLDNCSHYYLFLIIPFALAGVLFVFLLLKCNLTVSTGTVNALIFYANIIHVNSTIFFPKSKTILLTQILSVFLAWINLDLGIETCFYEGMNAYANTWLQFVFPVYIWILVLIMIYSSRYYVIASKLIGRNAVSVLATLFLLSYAKLLRTIIAAVSSIRVKDEDGTSHLLWLVDGNVPYFSGPHVALFIMAVLAVLLYIIPLTLLTLLAPCLQARTNHWIMRWVVRIKPLLDAYLGPYKDKYRYWTGVMLIVRVILFTVFAANTLGDPNVNLFAIILLTLLTVMFQTYKSSVYRSRINLILECFFNFNLCIFSTATLSLTSSERSSEYLACVMVGSSFIVFCCIVVWHFNQQTNLISRAFDKIKAMRRLRAGGDGEQQATDPPPPPQRQAQPTVSVIDMKELRESVLTNN